VDLLFQRRGNGLRHRFGAGAGIGRADNNLRRRQFGILCNRQNPDTDQACQHEHNGDDRRENGAVDEKSVHCLPAACSLPASAPALSGDVLLPASVAASTGLTGSPGAALISPSLMTRSPALRPSETSQASLSSRATVIGRTSTILSLLTT